jgi:hypothetical protein
MTPLIILLRPRLSQVHISVTFICVQSHLNRDGLGQRLLDGDVDLSLRSAYSLMGITPSTPQEVASDYYQIDFVSISCRRHVC